MCVCVSICETPTISPLYLFLLVRIIYACFSFQKERETKFLRRFSKRVPLLTAFSTIKMLGYKLHDRIAFFGMRNKIYYKNKSKKKKEKTFLIRIIYRLLQSKLWSTLNALFKMQRIIFFFSFFVQFPIDVFLDGRREITAQNKEHANPYRIQTHPTNQSTHKHWTTKCIAERR